MAGMRDKDMHDYLGVNLRRVYETVKQDVPLLQSAIARILTQLERGGRNTEADPRPASQILTPLNASAELNVVRYAV